MVYKAKKNKVDVSFCCAVLGLYIVGGNTLTFNLANRLPLKIADMAAVAFIAFAVTKYRTIRINKVELQLIGWLIIGTVSACLNSLLYGYGVTNTIYGILYTIRILFYIVLSNLMNRCFYENYVSTKRVFQIILCMYLAVCFIGFWQLIFFPIAREFYRIFLQLGVYYGNGGDPHVGRLLSTYFDPNYLASCLLIPLAITLWCWRQYGKKIYFIFATIVVATIVLTVSRSGMVGICFYLLCMFAQRKMKKGNFKKNILLIAIAIFLLVALFLSNARIIERILNSANDGSTYARFDSWNRGIEIIKKNLFLGIGFNMIGAYTSVVLHEPVMLSTGYGNDSSILVILITTGLIGAVYWFAILLINYLKNRGKKSMQGIVLQI